MKKLIIVGNLNYLLKIAIYKNCYEKVLVFLNDLVIFTALKIENELLRS